MCILYLLAESCVLHSLSHILSVCVFPKHIWGAGWSELIHGRKIQMDLIFSSVRFEFEFSGRSAAASFLPFYTHCIFSLWIYHDFESDKNILKKQLKKKLQLMPQNRIVWGWLSCTVDISIFLHAHTHWEVPPAENLFYINFPANLQGSRLAGAGNVRSAQCFGQILFDTLDI